MSTWKIVPDGYEVFHWPEFQALARRLGVDTDKPIRSMKFSIVEGECVEITTVQQGLDSPEAETTTIVEPARYSSSQMRMENLKQKYRADLEQDVKRSL